MRKLTQSLLAVAAVLALAPSPALAITYCRDICSASTSCDFGCWLSPRDLITCGEFGYCADLQTDPNDEMASVSRQETHQSDSEAPVCSEEQRAAEIAINS